MHLLFSNFLKFLYSPDDSAGTGAPSEAPADDLSTLELLSEEEEPVEVLDLDKVKPEGDDEEKESEPEGEDELEEIEKELEEPKEEDLELTTPVRRREILAKYPTLFKDFPYLEKAYYREQQFTELLPTIQDARVAVDKARILDQVEQQVMQGDISTVLHAARTENPESFLKVVDNYLPALRRVDQQAYYHVLGNVIKDTIVTMVREGRNLGEQGAPLEAAANVLNQFVFGSQNFTPSSPLSRQQDPQISQGQQQLQEQQKQQFYGQFESTKNDLQTRADNVLRSTIDQNIDPNKTMTDYVRNHASREAFETLENLMSRDTRFRTILDKLWVKAFEKRFDKDSTDRIKAAYLSKAKTLLPPVIKKARNDALRGLGRRSSDDSDDRQTSKRGPITQGRSTAPSSGKFRKASDIPKGMSTLDVLMKD